MKRLNTNELKQKELRQRYYYRFIGGLIVSVIMSLVMLIKELKEFIGILGLCD